MLLGFPVGFGGSYRACSRPQHCQAIETKRYVISHGTVAVLDGLIALVMIEAKAGAFGRTVRKQKDTSPLRPYKTRLSAE